MFVSIRTAPWAFEAQSLATWGALKAKWRMCILDKGATAQAHQRRSRPGVKDLHQSSRNDMGPCPKPRVQFNAGALDGSARRPDGERAVRTMHDVRGAHAERSLGRAAEACFRACTEARVTPHHHQMAAKLVLVGCCRSCPGSSPPLPVRQARSAIAHGRRWHARFWYG